MSSGTPIASHRNSQSPLIVGIDVRALEFDSSRKRGIGRYLYNLLGRMTKMNPMIQFRLFGVKPPWELSHLGALLESANVRYVTYHPSFAEELNVFLLTDPLPVLPNHRLMVYPIGSVPCATIIYDLIPLTLSEEYLAGNPTIYQQYMDKLSTLKMTVKRFLPISEFVAQELADRLSINQRNITPILGGLDDCFKQATSDPDIDATLYKYQIDSEYFLYTGGVDYRKNIIGLVQAFRTMKRSWPEPVKLVLVGEASAKWLVRTLAENDVDTSIDDIIFTGYVSDDELRHLYAGAKAFVFPSLYEGFGLPALEAMASGCPVIASNTTSLSEIVGDSGLLVDPTSVSEISAAMHRLLQNPQLCRHLRAKGIEHVRRYAWEDVATRTMQALREIVDLKPRFSAKARRMKVVLQNRANAYVARGGDTVVANELFTSLRALDVDVDVACGSPDLSEVDLVHVMNLTLTQMVEEAAANASAQNVPFAITTLYEDWPRYMEKSVVAITLFEKYLSSGMNQQVFQQGLARLRSLPESPAVNTRSAALNASALFACAESEAERLRDAYPDAAEQIEIVKFGASLMSPARKELTSHVHESLGFDRFVMCCGRLETRKNQLMLLKALEDSDLPIVFASGGFSCQPAYVDLVTRFRRKAPVKIVSRLEADHLAVLMSSASVHVLPSWYELPGLVTLEAASCGIPVVASDWGAIADYLPADLMHYCQPDDPDSIRTAIERALVKGPNPRTKAKADSYTWQAFGEATFAAYERILTARPKHGTATSLIDTKKNTDIAPMEATMNPNKKASSRFDASIIIPVYNRADLTQACLEAISSMNDNATYEVIVVDNHSTDSTSQILQAVEGDIKTLRESANRGFAVACNHGARMAEGEYLVFLNNDTIPQQGWLDAMLNCARKNTSVGAVGARLVYPDGTVQHAGIAVSTKPIPYHVFQNFPENHPAVLEERDMQAVTAACMVIPAKVFNEIEGFNEEFMNGFEDIDLCFRLRENNLRVIYCPEAKVVHYEESSEGRKTHDAENLERFMALWGNKLIADETELLARHGYRIEWGMGGGKYYYLSDAPETESTETSTTMETKELSLSEAKRLYEDGKLEKATEVLGNLTRQRMNLAGEDGFEAWQTLGNCLARLNRPDEAEEAFMEAIKFNESSERPYLGLGSVAMLRENWTAAQYGFMTALAKNPNTIKGEYGVALSMAARQMHIQAMERFERILAKEPYNAEALFGYYRCAMESGDAENAIEPIRTFLTKYPDDTNFLFNLCGAYWRAGRLSEAVETCQRVLANEPNHDGALEVMRHLNDSITVDA